MIVDDSAFVRGVIARWLGEEAGLTLVAAHPNGKRAADDVARSRPEVVVLDIDMPEMDGLTALPLILERRPGAAIIMATTPTRRDTEIGIRALTLGAADYVPKPEAGERLLSAAEFRSDLIGKIRSLAPGARRNARAHTSPAPVAPHTQHRIRPASASAVRTLVIGSSTGGPQALTRLFGHLGPALDSVPAFVTQHMPPTFTAILAEHIAKAAGRIAAEATDGEVVRPGRIYIAPGGRHLLLGKSSSATIIRLSDAPPVNFCKPAVDPMFLSAVEVYGSAVLGIVLTGSGSDGARGATAIADSGGSVIAQDEATSTVWGMPRAAVEAGACSAILPLAEIGPRIVRRLSGARE